ncbi:hypothetical protein R1sor_007219 [Riccia sorocarpa]|uniref:Uncharacterized protein n=1 Tax=Riccia sorocarpa TaxID=122646 RepID=A0ABD3HQA1_9MARC
MGDTWRAGYGSCMSWMSERRHRDTDAPPLGLRRVENLPADSASTQPEMASSRQRLADNKRNSSDADQVPESMKERMLHLNLENHFFEERVKVLEEEGRKNRLRIDELRAELRETKEELDKARTRVAEYSVDTRKQLEVTENCDGQDPNSN